MRKFNNNSNIKKQINKLYALTTIGYFQIAGASWVALLALRGFSMLEIGILESIFHVVSCIFEIPSGAFADVFGRKRTLTLSKLTSILSSFLMILSANFWTAAIAIGFSAISYNLESGTREALAYDSLKSVNCENDYNKFASTEMMLYRITNSLATLCAGYSLWLGYQKAYAVDIFFGLIAIGLALSLREVSVDAVEISTIGHSFKNVICESRHFFNPKQKSPFDNAHKCIYRCRIDSRTVLFTGEASACRLKQCIARSRFVYNGTWSCAWFKSRRICTKTWLSKIHYF